MKPRTVTVEITLTRPGPCPDCDAESRATCGACEGSGTCAEVEHEYEATCRVTLGSPATWCKSIGTWDPPDPGECEILSLAGPEVAPTLCPADLSAGEVERIEDAAFAAAEDSL